MPIKTTSHITNCYLDLYRFTTEAGLTAEPEFYDYYSCQFDGVDEDINYGDIAAFEYTQSFSGFVWIKVPNNNAYGVIGRYKVSAPYNGWWFYVHNGRAYFKIDGGGNYYTVWGTHTHALLGDDSWHFIGFTYDATEPVVADRVKTFFDGYEYTSVGYNGFDDRTIVPTGKYLYLGSKDHTGNFINGKLDDPCICNVALSAYQINTEAYNSGTPADLNGVSFSSNLYLWSQFSQADIDNFPTIKDYSGNSRDGTASNMEVGDIQSDVP